jgi:hypothetical protein
VAFLSTISKLERPKVKLEKQQPNHLFLSKSQPDSLFKKVVKLMLYSSLGVIVEPTESFG